MKNIYEMCQILQGTYQQFPNPSTPLRKTHTIVYIDPSKSFSVTSLPKFRSELDLDRYCQGLIKQFNLDLESLDVFKHGMVKV